MGDKTGLKLSNLPS